MSPKVFVSHASEDKERFVLDFAEKLRQNGIDAWLDKWEMLPGDSLVDKIFEEGIKEAQAFIIVLSQFSIQKPWVREELNAAVVKRINNGTKLIPIVIDDCEVPEALKSTVWERVPNVASYDSSMERIVATVFGASDKPPLGSAPDYTKSFVQSIGQLSNIDSLVLRMSCKKLIETGDHFINPVEIFFNEGKSSIPESELEDSLEILDQQGYIKIHRAMGGGASMYRVTTYGLEEYAISCLENYNNIVTNIISTIVNEGLASNQEITQHLNQKIVIVDHVLDVLEASSHIKVAKMIGGLIRIFNVSPSLKRALKG